MHYVAIFHANLNYAYLTPPYYERTIRASYETILDTFRERCPEARFVFEASGYTIDQIAALTPDVLEKLKHAIASGQCEFMGSPYSHPMLANFPEEDGRWANEFAMRAYEKHLGFRPESGWNPECSWAQYVPRTYRDVGYRYLTLDFESFKICNDPAYSWVERNRTRDMGWGGNLPWFDLDPDDPHLHRPFRDVVPGLHGFCRSDRCANRANGYFLGRLPLDDYIANVRRWSGTKDEGALLIVADDAEYCGTTGYFYVKHFTDYSKCFAVDPRAGEKLEALVKAVLELGPMITFKEACEGEPVDEPYFVEDTFAWHRTYASVWASTPESLRYDPQIALVRQDYKDNVQAAAEADPELAPLAEQFWLHLTNAENSDGRWPPPPAETCPFQREWVEKELAAARDVLERLKQRTPEPSAPPPDEEAGEEAEVGCLEAAELERLTWVGLQRSLYHAYKLYEGGADDEAREEGKRRIALIYDEYARRGVTRVVRPTLT